MGGFGVCCELVLVKVPGLDHTALALASGQLQLAFGRAYLRPRLAAADLDRAFGA